MPVTSSQAYGGTLISGGGYDGPTRRDLELRREMALLAELEAQAKLTEQKRRLSDPLEKAKMDASARQFETRRGVREVGAVPDFTPENFPPMASHESTQPIAPKPPAMRTIKRAVPEGPSERISTQFGDVDEPPMRTIRRFTDQGTGPVDPDAAMGAEQRARLDPSVLASEIGAKSRVDVANIEANALKGMGGKISPSASEDLATMATVEDLGRLAETLGDKIEWRGTGGFYEGSISQFGTKNLGTGTPEEQELRNYIGQIKGAIAKLRGGTSFTPNEQKLLDTYTPDINEEPIAIKAKIKGLNEFIALKRKNTLRFSGGIGNMNMNSGDVAQPDDPYDAYLKRRGGQ